MQDLWAMWKRAGNLMWDSVVQVVVLNLMWMISTLPVITVGPATLAAYWWTARVLRDETEPQGYKNYFQAFRRLFWRGIVWTLLWAALIGIAYANLRMWPRVLPPLAGAIVAVLWYYILIFAAAMQPYLLECLAVEELPWLESLKRSAWQVAANPIYSHLNMPIPVIVIGIGLRFHTLIPVILVALVILFMAVAAADAPQKYGEPPKLGGRIEDVL